jgi:predicted HicB family RNase H-like nuclease
MNLPNIEALIEYDGQINIGYHQPIGCIAVANDESNTLAMLKRRPKESLADLLNRLDLAIEYAIETDNVVDEVNPL